MTAAVCRAIVPDRFLIVCLTVLLFVSLYQHIARTFPAIDKDGGTAALVSSGHAALAVFIAWYAFVSSHTVVVEKGHFHTHPTP